MLKLAFKVKRAFFDAIKHTESLENSEFKTQISAFDDLKLNFLSPLKRKDK